MLLRQSMGTGSVRVYMLLCILALLPAVMIVLYAGHLLRSQVEARMLASGAQLTELGTILLEEHFRESKVYLEAYARRFVLRNAWRERDFSEVQRHLRQAREYNPDFVFVGIYETDGTLRGIDPPAPEVMGRNFAFRDWCKGVSRDWKPYISEVYRTDVKPNPMVVAVAVPILDDEGKAIGILMATHTLDVISGWMRRVQANGPWTVSVIDQHAILLDHPASEAPKPVVDLSSYEPAAHCLKGESGHGVFERDGERRFVSYRSVPAFHWGILVEQPMRGAEEGIAQVLRQVWLLAGIVAAVALICGFALAAHYRKLEEAERFFNLSNDILCIADFQGRFKRVNPAMSRILGYGMEELLRTPYLDLIHPDDVEATRAAANRVHDGDSVMNFENRYRCKDGTCRWLLWSAVPMRERKEMFAVARDVTERKNAEAELRQLNETLRARTAELDAVNKELEAFSYSVSHDLRAPLRSIDGFGQALLEDFRDKLGDDGGRFIERIRAGTQRMGHLIDDLLNLSRVIRKEIHREPVNLTEMANAIADELKSASPGRKARICVQEGIYAHGDAQLLKIALENLLGNAWKFTARKDDAHIEFSVKEQADGVKIYIISDNGAGFDPAYASKLFGAFKRLHSMEEFPGTGIGLATVSRIVMRHGGKIWAEGNVGKGAAFHFTLP